MKRALFSFLSIGLITACAQAAPMLVLSPSNGVVSGTPGSTVGWGFTLTNNTDYLVVTGSTFTPTSLYGNYQDYIGTDNFIVVGPSPESTSVSQSFDSTALTGVGGFTIDSTAPVGFSPSGALTIYYDLFSQDPNSPNFDPSSQIGSDDTLSQTVRVNITPEPASLLLMSAGFLLLAGGLMRTQ